MSARPDLEPGVLVDGEVAERMGAGGRHEHGQRERRDDERALHGPHPRLPSRRLAAGASSGWKRGVFASARVSARAGELRLPGAGRDRTEVPRELRIDGAEPVRALGLGQRLLALARRVERPGEGVVAVHGRPLRERLARQRDDRVARQRAGVRGLEERELEIGVAAGAHEQALLGAHERIGVAGALGVAARRAHVAELRDDLGQRQVRGGGVVPALGQREIAAGDGDRAEAGLRAGVVREEREGVAILLRRLGDAARLEQQRRELHARPLRVLGRARARGDRAAHEPDRAGDVARKLAGIAGAGVGDEPGRRFPRRSKVAKACG